MENTNRPSPYLGRAGETIEVLRRHNLSAQKRFGQNFLVDEHVIERILELAEIGEEDLVVEIGPGIGTMTQYLASRARKVLSVEVDEKLLPVLADTLSGWDNVSVIHQDILKTDIRALTGGEKAKVVANLPYYITTPILLKLLEEDLPISSISVMVQKEVADRMCAGPGSKDYGALSLAVQYYSCPEKGGIVPPHCFIPRPKVDSALIRLDKYEQPPLQVESSDHLFKLIRASFNQRRKTLANGVCNSGMFKVSRADVEEILQSLGFSATIRGEALTLEEFAKVSDLLLQRERS